MAVLKEAAASRLVAWHDVARWLDYCSAEFVADATTQGYLEHVAQCIREEGERRYAIAAGLEPATA